ncbi:DUF1015 domain-containing protein [Chloroflexota bacterium]
MAEIRPFRGAHYNEALIKDWAAITCPVYDIITPQQQQELYLRSEYNFVRLEFGRELPQDTATDNRYTRAAATLERWLKQGILEIDEAPAIYLYDQYFTHQGKEYKRRGIIARVRMEEWDRMVVRPHEGTLAEPKNDRVSLLWALQANTSSILALYEDEGQQISHLLAEQEQNQPTMNLRSANGESHNIWAIKEPKVVNMIASGLAEQPLYVADGHHRYESALAYQHERTAYSPSVSGDEAFNFVMMTLVDFADPGLIILPPHRLVRGISKSTLNGLMPKLKTFFEIEELPLSMPGVWKQVSHLLAETDEIRLILFGLASDRLFMLRLRDLAAVSQMIPYFHSELYKRLDVSITDHIILEKLLELNTDKEKALLAYSYDTLDAVNRVLAQEYQLAVLLSPVKSEVIKAIADTGDKMPRKSTYFYPKLPAGIIFNRLV